MHVGSSGTTCYTVLLVLSSATANVLMFGTRLTDYITLLFAFHID
jgi:hypothetical protein